MHDYVYLRDNPAGPHRELWYHGAGCRSWLVVDPDTRTHEITGVSSAREVALQPPDRRGRMTTLTLRDTASPATAVGLGTFVPRPAA